MKYNSLFVSLLIFLFSVPLFSNGNPSSLWMDPLTREERQWYENNKNRIIAAIDADFAPYEFLDEKKRPSGIAIDVVKLIEERLHISLKKKFYKKWSNILKDARRGKLMVLQTVQNTESRRQYLNFTSPYLFIPNVIIVRNDWEGVADITRLRGKKIAVVKDFATVDYLKKNHPGVKIVPVDNNTESLKELAFRRVDATIMHLGLATYNINKLGITNLKVGEHIDFEWQICLGTPKEYPLLHSIMQKGLDMVSKEEIESFHQKWITIEQRPFYKRRNFQIIIGSVTGFFLLVIFLVSLWNRTLARQVAKKTRQLQESHDSLEEKVQERTAELTKALEDIKELKGLIPVCASCKKIRDDDGYWSQVDEYLVHHTDAEISHGLCNECAEKLYGDQKWYKENNEKPGKE